MSIPRAPSLGPIVGHTTAKSCKLWIRAQDSSAFQVGVVAVLEKAGEQLKEDECSIFYFRLGRLNKLDKLTKERNHIGIFNLGEEDGLSKGQAKKPLNPDTEYKVCLATLTINDFSANHKDLSDEALKQQLPDPKKLRNDFNNLGKKSVALFRTFPQSDFVANPQSKSVANRLTFLLGSCHYPGSDSIFHPMDQQVCDAGDADRPRFVLMVGDQIYADKWSRYIDIERAETYEDFQERYRTAFGSGNMRRLLRHVPTYMILDDHEIEDNWSSERLESPEKKSLFCNAIRAYKNYQWSHGPCNFGAGKFYYTFNVAGYPFFVLDTRTLRTKNKNDITKNDMLGQDQLNDLCEWLKQMQQIQQEQQEQQMHGNVPKFIVSSNVFVPNETEERTDLHNRDYWLSQSDSWPAFPKTRDAILTCIVENKIQNVVFLSGDIHCSNVAEIELTDSAGKSLTDLKNEPLKVFSITSSPFYSLISDGDPEDYVSDSRASEEADSFPFGKGLTMNYRSSFPFVANADNFCRVEIDKENRKIVIHFFDDDGDAMGWIDADSKWESHCFKMESW